MKKKPIAILLIFVWILQAVSPSFFYTTGRWAIKANNFSLTEEEVEEKNKEVLHFSSLADVDWEEEGEELIMNGDLYDVLSVEQTANGVDIICFSDAKESKIAQLAACQNEKDQSDQGILKQVFKNKIIADSRSFVIEPRVTRGSYSTYCFTTVIEPVVNIYIPPPRA